MLLILFVIIIFSSLLTLYSQYHIITDNANKSIATSHIHIKKSFNLSLNKLKESLLNTSQSLLTSNNIKNFAEKNRDGLYKSIKPFYEKLTKNSSHIKIITFRDSFGKTFLRVHKPALYGDPINPNREIIIDANNEQKTLYGFEVGKLKMSYRIAVPIFYNSKHIGVLEIGVEPEFIMKETKEIFNTIDALYLKNKFNDSYSFVRGDKLFSPLQQISSTKMETLQNDFGKNHLINTDINLLNHKNHIAAKLLLAYNIESYHDSLSQMFKDITINILISMFIVFIVLHFFIRYFMRKTTKLNDELEEINQTLEERINIEVEKNRDKDHHMIEQSRMAQMGEMLSMIAHQWRQPLAAISVVSANIRVNLALSKHDLNDDEGQNNHISDLEKALKDIDLYVQSLTGTINDFRNFYKPDKELQHVSLDVPASKALSIIRASLESEGIEIIEDYQSERPLLLHENELMQVVLSILKNAEDKLNEDKTDNGAVYISTYDVDDTYTALKISDNGNKIDEEIISKIFEPYFSTKDAKNGTGLGLYMSKTIISKHHKGKIYANNENSAVSFIIELPLDKTTI
jgi:two-component system, NtrC family, C4-dicarboxylate transport sensor histidine kinase DctB